MAESRRTSSCDDLTHRIAVYRALGFTIERIAVLCESSESTVKRHMARQDAIQLESLVRTCVAQSDQKVAEAAFEDAKGRITRILAKALGASEALVDRAIESQDFSQLRDAHNVGMWAAKFEVSEAPKRLQVEQTHTHQMSEELIERLKGLDRLIPQYDRLLLSAPKDVIDVDPIPAN